MTDPSANSSDRGFVPFRAATAISVARGEGEAPADARVPPPLPPPPPGAPAREVARPAASRPAPGHPARPALPAGATRADAWRTLVDWCLGAGLAEGGLLADPAGMVLEARGLAASVDHGRLAATAAAATTAAQGAAGDEPAAIAIDLGARWVNAFPVRGPGGEPLVAVLWGALPFRGPVRSALRGWVEAALARAR